MKEIFIGIVGIPDDTSAFIQAIVDSMATPMALKEKDEEIAKLKAELDSAKQSYNALLDYFNSENPARIIQEETFDTFGHQLLNGRQILVIGACACKSKHLLGYAKRTYGFVNSDFRFIPEYEKIKNRQIRLRFDKLAGIIVGPVPHYSEDISHSLMKFISDWQGIVPVVVCKSKNGGIKITKKSFADSLVKLISDIKKHM